MSVKNVQGHIDAIERKLGKSIKIAEKGQNLKLQDVVKMGTKTRSIVSEIKKAVSAYEVSQLPSNVQENLSCISVLTMLEGRRPNS